MAIAYKVLGQSAPTSTANANLYTVPGATQAVASTLVITNTTTSSATAQVYARVGGAAAATSNAVVYNLPVAGNGVIALTIGLTLAATDVVTVQTGTANALTFQLFGSEVA